MARLATSYNYLLTMALALIILKGKVPKVLENHYYQGLVITSTPRTRGVMSLVWWVRQPRVWRSHGKEKCYNQRKGNGWWSGKAIHIDYKKITKMDNTKDKLRVVTSNTTFRFRKAGPCPGSRRLHISQKWANFKEYVNTSITQDLILSYSSIQAEIQTFTLMIHTVQAPRELFHISHLCLQNKKQLYQNAGQVCQSERMM